MVKTFVFVFSLAPLLSHDHLNIFCKRKTTHTELYLLFYCYKLEKFPEKQIEILVWKDSSQRKAVKKEAREGACSLDPALSHSSCFYLGRNETLIVLKHLVFIFLNAFYMFIMVHSCIYTYLLFIYMCLSTHIYIMHTSINL